MSSDSFHRDALVKRIRDAMFASDALWATDVDRLAEIAVDAIGDWLLEDAGIGGIVSGPFTSREKWLRFDALERRAAGNQPKEQQG